MDAEWSVAAANDDPVIVVPWRDEQSRLCYLDLQASPHLIDQIPEARQWPEIRSALMQLNAPGSPVWTAKCDAWELSDEEKQLDFGPVAVGFGAYLDILDRNQQRFSSLDIQIAYAKSLASSAGSLSPQDAAAQFVVRPAQWHEREGYAVTAYIYGYGQDPSAARFEWQAALRSTVTLLCLAGTESNSEQTVE